MMEEHVVVPGDLSEQARVAIERAEAAGDGERLETLDRLYEALEAEIDETPPPGR